METARLVGVGVRQLHVAATGGHVPAGKLSDAAGGLPDGHRVREESGVPQ